MADRFLSVAQNFNKSIWLPEYLQDEWRLIWVYIIYSGLSVRILNVNTVSKKYVFLFLLELIYKGYSLKLHVMSNHNVHLHFLGELQITVASLIGKAFKLDSCLFGMCNMI